MRAIGAVVGSACALGLLSLASSVASGRVVSERFQQLTRGAVWKPAGARLLGFDTFHPQGLVKIGDAFYLSSVEVTVPPARFAQPVDGADRSAGQGRGHLFKFAADGQLLSDLILGDGSMYHPGGIDFDGQFIWVPVGEYRPDSRSIIYRVDPLTMTATEVFRYSDHLGAVVHDADDRALHAVTWGSRRFLRWPLDARGRVVCAPAVRSNSSFYVDYQDCKGLGAGEMLCGGVNTYRVGGSAASLAIGGMDLVSLKTGRPIHQLPIELWTDTARPMTQNPFWVEPVSSPDGGLRMYFLPEDGRSTLYTFDVSGAGAR